MKTFEESGVYTADIEQIIDSVRRNVQPNSVRDFLVGLLRTTREKGEGPHTRQVIGGYVGRDAEKCAPGWWVKAPAIQKGFEARRAVMSECLGGRMLDLELIETGSHLYRIGIFDSGDGEAPLEVPYQISGSVLRYRTGDGRPRLSWVGKITHPGVGEKREQYRKLLFLTPFFTLCGLFALCGLMLSFSIWTGFRSGGFPVLASVTFVALGVLIWWSLTRRWERLFEDRILLLGMGDVAGDMRGVVLDRVEIDGVRSIVLRHYVADCPICQTTSITLAKGGPEFPRRIVGRCDNSPREHVFSFDRVTLEGGPLRQRRREEG
jgi:hypothetical protein